MIINYNFYLKIDQQKVFAKPSDFLGFSNFRFEICKCKNAREERSQSNMIRMTLWNFYTRIPQHFTDKYFSRKMNWPWLIWHQLLCKIIMMGLLLKMEEGQRKEEDKLIKTQLIMMFELPARSYVTIKKEMFFIRYKSVKLSIYDAVRCLCYISFNHECPRFKLSYKHLGFRWKSGLICKITELTIFWLLWERDRASSTSDEHQNLEKNIHDRILVARHKFCDPWHNYRKFWTPKAFRIGVEIPEAMLHNDSLGFFMLNNWILRKGIAVLVDVLTVLTRAYFLQITPEIMLLPVNNLHEKNTMHKVKTDEILTARAICNLHSCYNFALVLHKKKYY